MKVTKQELLIIPGLFFLCSIFVFWCMKGGSKAPDMQKDSIPGVNPNLPDAKPDGQKTFVNKTTSYEQAEADSMKRRQQREADVIRYLDTGRRDTVLPGPNLASTANQLLQQLDRMQQAIHQPQPAAAPYRPSMRQLSYNPPPMPRQVDTPEPDPQIEKLNAMLDKVIRIQHPAEAKAAADKTPADEVIPVDSSGNALSAVVIEGQTLSTGMTMGLRLMEAVIVDGVPIPPGQLIYGTVTINSDRMQVNVGAIRYGHHLFKTALQVYDLDGLEGIHVPGLLSRDVAKQSADQGAGSVNINNYDPSLGAQATNAGIQTAKTFFSRKVRLVRATVRAGYQVLLKNTKYTAPLHRAGSLGVRLETSPPGFAPGGSSLVRCRRDGLELMLKGIYLKDSLLWFALVLTNHSPIAYHPAYIRWFIRDRKKFKRTAVQDWTLEPVYEDSCWTGFQPFGFGKEKQLVIEVGDQRGQRTLELEVSEKLFKRIKIAK